MTNALGDRIRDRLTIDWLTESERKVWDAIKLFGGAPHRVINVYGPEGSGKTFLGWLMERERYASYSVWGQTPSPSLPRLVFDDAPSARSDERAIRPLIDAIPGLQQVILLTRNRVDEVAMPSFEVRVTENDWEHFRANLYRYLSLTVSETNSGNYWAALEHLG
jgi:hypothetical protein